MKEELLIKTLNEAIAEQFRQESCINHIALELKRKYQSILKEHYKNLRIKVGDSNYTCENVYVSDRIWNTSILDTPSMSVDFLFVLESNKPKKDKERVRSVINSHYSKGLAGDYSSHRKPLWGTLRYTVPVNTIINNRLNCLFETDLTKELKR